MNPRSVLRIARWEVSRGTGSLDRRTGAVIVVGLLAVVALGPMLAGQGTAPGAGIYRVGVTDSSPYYDAVSQDARLRVVNPEDRSLDAGEMDVACADGVCAHAPSEKGRAAFARLRSAVEAYNDRVMGQEPDQAAAFPVEVTLRYVPQHAATGSPTSPSGDATGDSADAGTGADAGDGSSPSADSTGSTGSGGSATGDGTDSGGGFAPSFGQSLLSTGTQSGSPADISPPFPLQSVLLAFAFILPLNFVSQAYGSSVIAERVNRRGELLLVAPVSRVDIVAGKTLPYLLVAVGTAAAIAAFLGAGPVTVAAVTPVALLFLAATFVGAMFARSFKELTFVTVTASVLITTYTFIPAIFTDVHPIAAISPLSVVVADLSGSPVDLVDFLFPTAPVTLAALVLFALGAGVYREEDMFTQKSVPAKALDALAAQLHSRRRVALWSALFIPFVLIAELLAVAVLFLVPVAVSIPAVLVVVAVVEEVAKSVHVYAGFARSKFDRTARTAVALGVASGLGFFAGEKLTLAAQFVGLPDLAVGRAAFAVSPTADPVTLAALLVAPLLLHTVTATVSALGARRTRWHYLAALVVAVGLHATYNATVVTTLV